MRGLLGAAPTAEELDEQEQVFLEDMFALLQAAHFRVLRVDEWATAQEESFTVRCCLLPSTPRTR